MAPAVRGARPMSRAGIAIVAALAVTLGSAGAASAAEPGMTYESIEQLPDLSGGWVPELLLNNAASPAGPPALPPEVRPEAAARFAERVKQFSSGANMDRGYCAPVAFGGRLPWSAGGSLEILLTPGRVTIAAEVGLVRRIYLRDTPPPEALEESRGGTSIGHWEGETLVVETTGLSRNAWLPPGIILGRNVRVAERIFLKDPDTLVVESTVTAPDALLAPLKTTNTYRRDRERYFTEFDTCVTSDRSFDQASRQERFDATPPGDLPPPPSD